MVHITSLVIEKMQFSHYKSMEAFGCHGNQTKRQIAIILAIFRSPLPKQHSYQIRDKSVQWLLNCRPKVLMDAQMD